MTVAIGLNNQVEAGEAAKTLGCAYSTIINLLTSKKIKGQKLEGRWMVDYTDLQRAKTTHLIKPRVRKKPKLVSVNSQTDIEEHIALANKTNIQISIDKDKLRFIELVLQGSDHTVLEFIQIKLEELHNNAKDVLKNIKI